MYTYKVMLKPNNEQMTRIRKTANMVLLAEQIVFMYLDAFIKRKERIPSCKDVRKWFTIQKKIHDEEIIKLRSNLTKKEQRIKNLDTLFYDVSNDALKQGIKDVYNSFIRFFKKESEYPVMKDFKSNRKSFYVDPYKVVFTNTHVKLEKISLSMKENRRVINNVKLVERGRIPVNVKYSNPRVVIEDDRAYIVVSTDRYYGETRKNVTPITEEIGIDVNIRSIDTSKLKSYLSPIKTKKYRRLEKSYKRIQRKISRQALLAEKNNIPLYKCKNRNKNKIIMSRKKRRIRNIVEGFHDNVINDIISYNPISINIEDIDIKQMLKNKKISKNIQESAWRKFYIKLTNRSDKYKIKVNKIDRFFPSSKRCNKCGSIKEELSLKERIYCCEKCGFKIRRDFNAALNIKNYYSIINN